MNHLIRVKSTDNRADFVNDFSSDIVLKENAKIATLSATIPLTDKFITIGDTNNSFRIATGHILGGGPDYLTVNLTNGEYSKNELENHIHLMLNKSLTFDDTTPLKTVQTNIGTQYACNLTPTNKMEILFKRSQALELTVPDANKFGLIDVAGATISLSGGSQGSAFTNTLFTKGCGYFRAKVSTNTNDKSIGLLDHTFAGSQITTPDYKYGLMISGGNYHYIIDGSPTNTGVAAAIDDYMFLHTSGGNLKFYKYVNDNNITLLHSVNFDYTEDYRVGLTLDSATSKFTFCKSVNDARLKLIDGKLVIDKRLHNENVLHDFNVNDVDDLGARPPPPKMVATPFVLSFVLKPNLAKLLGFGETFYSIIALTGKYDAEDALDVVDKPKMIKIELASNELESYDLDRRKNIITYIPYQGTLKEIVYQPPVPVPVSLRNPEPINMRHFHIRLLDDNDNLVVLTDNADIVFYVS